MFEKLNPSLLIEDVEDEKYENRIPAWHSQHCIGGRDCARCFPRMKRSLSCCQSFAVISVRRRTASSKREPDEFTYLPNILDSTLAQPTEESDFNRAEDEMDLVPVTVGTESPMVVLNIT